MCPTSDICARSEHIPLDLIDHWYDVNGTLVAHPDAILDALSVGAVVTGQPRRDSPNGLAWPGVTPRRAYEAR